jgi:predicted acylesterase/phospholipase RssA
MQLSKRVFQIDNVKMGVPVGGNRCRFNEKPLEDALKDVVRKTTGDEGAPMADPNEKSPRFCCVFVIATEGQDGNGPEKLFRSYRFDKDRCPIWQAARATSAAPSYFPPAWVEVPVPGGWFIDGGLKSNNPSAVGLKEAKRVWKARQVLIVSIGTGVQKTADFIENPEPPAKAGGEQSSGGEESKRSDSKHHTSRIKRPLGSMISSFGGRVRTAASNLPLSNTAVQFFRIPRGVMTLKRFAQELVKLSTQSESTHTNMWELANSHDPSQPFPYYRFNVPSGMDEIGLEEWRNMIKMSALTRSYLRTPAVESELRRCAESLLNSAQFESM